eukprot:XP_011675495.1 PREDICTED: uncharacterized protein LOC105443694 isoform X2 [Strongylocentrotus purpuratus]
MATKCSKTIITSLTLILLITSIIGNVNATDQVPDNQVWTPPTATFFYGQPKANISCKFLGTPYGVYWMKGSSPATADTLLSLTKGEVSGPKFDDGSLTITEDYSLVFNNVQAGDEGNYICRVSNHNGYLFDNNTDVMVLDPAQVSIFTEPSITGWAGHSVNLQCAFRGTPERVLWNRVQGEAESKSVETVLRYTSGGNEVLGDRRYSWSDNYGLIIRDLRVLDEGNFTCMVSKTGGTEIQNTTVLAVHARAEKPYIQIAQCKSQPEIATNGTTPEPCQYNVTEDKDSFELQCSVIRAKPRVDILWQEESQNLTASQIVTQRGDGAFDVTATISRRTNQSDQFHFRCIASGLAVNGTAERTVIVEIIKPVQGSLSGSLSGGYIFLILLLVVVISAFLIFVVCRGWKYHKTECPRVNYVSVESKQNADSGTRRGFKWIMTRDCVCWVFCCKKKEDRTHESVEIQSLNEEETELGNLREKLKSYRPGKDTGMAGVDIPDSSIHIGLFGAMGAGKSSFINSLHFALKDDYKNVAIEAGNAAGGGQTKFRETVQLTDHIHIVDNRGMKDFSSEQIEKHLMPQIRGERGLDPKEKVKKGTGKQIHCPVFVCNLSQPVGRASTLKFITEFSDKVKGHFGRNVMVAVTHKSKLDGSAEADGSLEEVVRLIIDDGGVPSNSIQTFENYTEDCHAHDAMKSIEYLKFLCTCLEIGEINIKAKKKEKKNF